MVLSHESNATDTTSYIYAHTLTVCFLRKRDLVYKIFQLIFLAICDTQLNSVSRCQRCAKELRNLYRENQEPCLAVMSVCVPDYEAWHSTGIPAPPPHHLSLFMKFVWEGGGG
jgi:hypothetical protein